MFDRRMPDSSQPEGEAFTELDLYEQPGLTPVGDPKKKIYLSFGRGGMGGCGFGMVTAKKDDLVTIVKTK